MFYALDIDLVGEWGEGINGKLVIMRHALQAHCCLSRT